jgi:catechol 2,3-dioxygenase-like lactoylglutathione lyase family enzyme
MYSHFFLTMKRHELHDTLLYRLIAVFVKWKRYENIYKERVSIFCLYFIYINYMLLIMRLKLKFRKIVETCIYSYDLEKMKDFYVNTIGLQFISEEKGRHVFLKVGKSMLLIFNPKNTMVKSNSIFPIHGAITPPSIVHFALEIEKEDYENSKTMLNKNKIEIEKEIIWKKGTKSIYFRDPIGNLVEFITRDSWPVED